MSRGGARGRAFAGRRRRSAQQEKPEGSVYVPVEVVRARLRPNWQQASRWPSMLEDAELLPDIRGRCRDLGLYCYHTAVAIGSDTGYPDLTIWGPGGVIWRELKASDGRVKLKQLDQVEALRAAGADARFWWPEDWHLGVVDAELLALTRPRAGVVALPRLGQAEPGTGRPAAGRLRLGPAERKPGVLYRFCGCEYGRPHERGCRLGTT